MSISLRFGNWLLTNFAAYDNAKQCYPRTLHLYQLRQRVGAKTPSIKFKAWERVL